MLADTIPEWNLIKRCVKADITGIGEDESRTHYAPYPVQNSIHYFSKSIRDKCLSELEKRKLSRSNESTNFADFSKIHFGETLQSKFIRLESYFWCFRTSDILLLVLKHQKLLQSSDRTTKKYGQSSLKK